MTKVALQLTAGASLVASISDRIEAGEELSAALRDTFDIAMLRHADGVDRAISFRHANEALQAKLKLLEERAKDERKRLEAMDEAFRKQVKATLEANANIPFKGELGTISLRKGPPAVETVFGDKKLDPATIDMFAIESRFVRQKTEYALDAKAVRAALDAGEKLDWATVEQKQYPYFW